jgi:allophanate hydrolase
MDPTVAKIILGASNYTAVDTFNAAYRLEYLRAKTKPVWKTVDVIVLPTAPRTYTIEEIAESPIERNSHLGHYTNFVNLLDLSAVAVPSGVRPDGLPFGVSLIGEAFQEASLLVLADRLHRSLPSTLGGSDRMLEQAATLQGTVPPPGCLLMAVVGAHLTGS